MALTDRIRARFLAIMRRGDMEREMREEMTAHIEQAAERLVARGMSRQDALLAARKEFGQPGVIQEEAREARGLLWIDNARGDIRFAFRNFARTPLTTVTIVLTLMLGIGGNAALYSVIHGVTSRPAPGVPDDPALAFIRPNARFGTRGLKTELSYPLSALDELKTVPMFSDVAGWTTSNVITTIGDGDAEIGTAIAQYVTPNYFPLSGVRLRIGNGFIAKRLDDRGSPELSVILGYALWRQAFGADSAIVGRRFKISGVAVTVVGVAPRRFNGVKRSSSPRMLFLPVSARSVVEATSDPAATESVDDFHVFARLRPGQSLADATPAVKLIGARIAAARRELPQFRQYRDEVATLVPINTGEEIDLSPSSDLIVGAIFVLIGGLVLLVCCTTVGSLLVGLAMARRQEIGVRLSLGASRARVVRQLLTEITILALAGGACGLGIYAAIVRQVGDRLRDIDLTLDWSSAIVTALIAVIAAVVCGLSPALHATRRDLASVLKDSGATSTGKSRLQRTFVVTQIALTQPLLVGLAMMVAVLIGSLELNAGSEVGDRVLRVEFSVVGGRRLISDGAGHRADDAEAGAQRLVQRLRGLPAIVSVVQVDEGTMTYTSDMSVVVPEGAPPSTARPFHAQVVSAAPDYFTTLNIPLLRGRALTATDDQLKETPIVIATDLAEELFGQANPIGQRLQLGKSRDPSYFIVVGVVSDKDVGPSGQRPGQRRIFAPRRTGIARALLIRSTGPAEPLIPTIRSIALAEAPALPIRNAKTLAQIERDTLHDMLAATGAAAAGGLLALFLGAIGLYAVVSLGVRQRQREIGVRVALGAEPARVVRMFFSSGVRLGLFGLAIGLPLSVAALWVFANMAGVPSVNMPVIGSVVALAVLAVAALATWLPARHAAGVDPMVALKAE